MSPLLVAVFVAAPAEITPEEVFERARGAYQRPSPVRAEVTSKSTIGLGARGVAPTETQATYVLNFDPDKAFRLEMRQPAAVGLPARHLLFLVSPTRGYSVDMGKREYIQRTVPQGASFYRKIVSTVGEVETAVNLLIEPGTMVQYLMEQEALGGWRVVSTSPRMVVRRDVSGLGVSQSARLEFDPSNYRLLEVATLAAGVRIQWTYRYSPLSGVDVSPPRGFRSVSGFSSDVPKVNYRTPAARRLAEKVGEAYRKLPGVRATVTGATGESQIWWTPVGARLRNRAVDWSYAGGELDVVYLVSKQRFRGAVNTRDLELRLQRAGIEADPLLIDLIRGQNPISRFLIPGAEVQIAGKVRDRFGEAEILRIVAGNIRMSIAVDGTGRIVQAIIDNVTSSGTTTGTAERRITYHVGTPNAEQLKVAPPSGTSSPQPLSQLGRRT